MGLTYRYFCTLLFVLFTLSPACYADITIPNLVGLTLEKAKQHIKDNGLSLGSIKEQRTSQAEGTIIVQAPSAGKKVSDNYPVRLIVAIPLVKPKMVTVPDVKGMTLSQAKSLIESANLHLGEIIKRKTTMDVGKIYSQSPVKGKQVIINGNVDLTVSAQIDTEIPEGVGVKVPDVLGLDLESAKKKLEHYGLTVGAIKKQKTNRPTGSIIVQAPAANARVAENYPIRLVIAIPLDKQKTTIVPNLQGMSLSQAKAAIIAANLTLGKITTHKRKMPTPEVLSQSPIKGKKLIINSKVDLVISEPTATDNPPSLKKNNAIADKNKRNQEEKQRNVVKKPHFRKEEQPKSMPEVSTETERLRVFVLAGQSNMMGRGTTSRLPKHLKKPPKNVAFYTQGRKRELTNYQYFGPEVQFAHSVSEAFPNDKIIIIKAVATGSSISQWQPAQPLYEGLLRQISFVIDPAKISIDAIVWMQGETDARNAVAAKQYAKNLNTFIRSLRRDLHAENSLFLVGRITQKNNNFPMVDEIRKAQDQADDINPNTTVIATDNLSKLQDSVHFDNNGLIELGRRFANVFVKNRKG